jgi:hypothetical protein
VGEESGPEPARAGLQIRRQHEEVVVPRGVRLVQISRIRVRVPRGRLPRRVRVSVAVRGPDVHAVGVSESVAMAVVFEENV